MSNVPAHRIEEQVQLYQMQMAKGVQCLQVWCIQSNWVLGKTPLQDSEGDARFTTGKTCEGKTPTLGIQSSA